jgi:hypothetical protein
MTSNGWAFSIVDSVIIPHAHRIQTLSCMIHGNREVVKFLKIAEGLFSILESVEICFVNTWERPISSFPVADCLDFTALRTSPCLRHATFHLLNGLHPIDLHLPWSQISTLNLGTIAMPVDTFIRILHASTWQLEDGTFYVRFTKPLPPHLVLSRNCITMHALRMLHLRLLFPSRDHRIFSLLRLPALQRLRVEMYDQFQDWDVALYTQLLAASTKTLRDLRLEDYSPTASKIDGFKIRRRHRETTYEILTEFFRVIANIESLHLPMGLDIDAATANEIATYKLLPKLSMLDFSTVHGWPIVAMARRRHALWLAASLVEHPEFVTGSSAIGYYPGPPPKNILMQIPSSWSEQDERVLVEEAQALGAMGTTCTIKSTEQLPLPIHNPREIMRLRLLAWVDGVPSKDLI